MHFLHVDDVVRGHLELVWPRLDHREHVYGSDGERAVHTTHTGIPPTMVVCITNSGWRGGVTGIATTSVANAGGLGRRRRGCASVNATRARGGSSVVQCVVADAPRVRVPRPPGAPLAAAGRGGFRRPRLAAEVQFSFLHPSLPPHVPIHNVLQTTIFDDKKMRKR